MNRKIVSLLLILGATGAFADSFGHNKRSRGPSRNAPVRPDTTSEVEPTAQELSVTPRFGNVLCPVDGERIDSLGGIPVIWRGKVLSLSKRECRRTFFSDPQRYALMALWDAKR